MHGRLQMMRIDVGRARRLGVLVLLPVLAAVGCASQRPHGDMGMVPPGGKHDKIQHPGNGSPPSPGMRYQGQLPEKLDWFKSRADSFYTLIEHKKWNGFRADRKCKKPGNQPCDPGVVTDLTVQAISDAHKISVDLDPAIRGVVIGRVYNEGNYHDETTNIPPRQGARADHYYVVIERGTPTRARLWIARVRFQANGRPERDLEVFEGANGYAKCPGHAEDPARTEGFADFADCTDPQPKWTAALPYRGSGGTGTGPFNAAGLLRFGPSNGMSMPMPYDRGATWFSCTEGCCSAAFRVP